LCSEGYIVISIPNRILQLKLLFQQPAHAALPMSAFGAPRGLSSGRYSKNWDSSPLRISTGHCSGGKIFGSSDEVAANGRSEKIDIAGREPTKRKPQT
jgi:hypothetical protein